MNNIHSNSASKPWRKVLHVVSPIPTVEVIWECFRQRVKDADAKRDAEVEELNRARQEAIDELFPEDVQRVP